MISPEGSSSVVDCIWPDNRFGTTNTVGIAVVSILLLGAMVIAFGFARRKDLGTVDVVASDQSLGRNNTIDKNGDTRIERVNHGDVPSTHSPSSSNIRDGHGFIRATAPIQDLGRATSRGSGFVSIVSPYVHTHVTQLGESARRIHSSSSNVSGSAGLGSVRDIREQYQQAKSNSIQSIVVTEGDTVTNLGKRSMSARLLGDSARTGTGLSLASSPEFAERPLSKIGGAGFGSLNVGCVEMTLVFAVLMSTSLNSPPSSYPFQKRWRTF